MSDFDQALRLHLDTLDKAGRLRRLRNVDGVDGAHISLEGREYINFSSNDYLGLAGHSALVERAFRFAEAWGAGSRASRLVCGNIAPFEAVEAKIAAGKGSEAALVMASGYQCNASVIPALLDRQVWGAEPLAFCDRLNHASMHMGLAAANLRQIRYRHNDLNHLEDLLKAHQGEKAARFILTESVFSMDGDRADIPALVELAERYGAFLYVDEAHATGVLGENGFGLTEGLAGRIGLVMGTFSKALGSFGAYVACSSAVRDYLVNRCTGLIYATALPPSVLGAMDAALDLIPELGGERLRLAALGEKVRRDFQAAGLDTGPSSTQIIPVILGEESRALAVARALEDEGILGIAIRPPTVPSGTSRIRFALSAKHRDQDVERLIAVVTDLAGAS
ncbi:8-amino-7-oxononanoate synthase [Telmatospirillum sp. J64-1]|uniref:8-amino-7-oxononanoate synthase n=1 Tax=Telmatospirillum sp. J64-1 TaxID=2502183 RepID=UPI00115C4C83|nr:8-amino-7-oxononanoate synthase [Telmatospirillum sp. J64-1]